MVKVIASVSGRLFIKKLNMSAAAPENKDTLYAHFAIRGTFGIPAPDAGGRFSSRADAVKFVTDPKADGQVCTENSLMFSDMLSTAEFDQLKVVMPLADKALSDGKKLTVKVNGTEYVSSIAFSSLELYMDPNTVDYPIATQSFYFPFEDVSEGTSGFTLACIDPTHTGFYRPTPRVAIKRHQFSVKMAIPRGLDKENFWYLPYETPTETPATGTNELPVSSSTSTKIREMAFSSLSRLFP